MVSYYLEIKVQIEEVIPDTNHTRNQHSSYEIVQGECCHKKRNRAGNGECAANSNEDEIHIAVVDFAAGTLKYVLSRDEIVNRDRNHECEGSRDKVGDKKHFRHDPEEYEIERKGRSANGRVLEKAFV